MRHILTAIAIVMASMTHAQDAEVGNGTVFGDWVVSCDAVTTQRVACHLSQTQTLTENNALILRMLAYALPEGRTLFAAQVPMGVYLPGGALFRAESASDDAVTPMIWQRCLGQICEAALQLEADAFNALATEEALLFAYQPAPGAERRIARVPLNGLADGLAAIRVE